MTPFIHTYMVDVRSGMRCERARYPVGLGDALADRFVVAIMDGSAPVDLTGVGVVATVLRSDGMTVPLEGEIENGAACVTLDDKCYDVGGNITVTVSLEAGEMRQSVLQVAMNVATGETDVIAETSVLNVADVLAAAERAEAAAERAEDAAANAGTGGGSGSGLPTGGAAHQQLVTDADGNATWEDRTHYTTIEEVTVLPEGDYTLSDSMLMLTEVLSPTLVEGGEYTVMLRQAGLGEATYEETGKACVVDGLDVVYIGNPSLVGAGDDDGKPYVMFALVDTGLVDSVGFHAAFLCPSFGEGALTIRVAGVAETTVKIPEKYIPDPKNGYIVNGSQLGSVRTVFSAEENDEYVIGKFAFAEGEETKASGGASHSEGQGSDASSAGAHAEGVGTTSSNQGSHSEGDSTVASGWAAHAEGLRTKASGVAAHAEGIDTIAAGNGQHVQGARNIEDTENRYAHIVGNGSGTGRSNAHTVDWDGNAWFAGDMYIGGTSQDDAKKLATVEELQPFKDYITITPGSESEVAQNVMADTSITWQENLYVNFQTGATSAYDGRTGTEDYIPIPAGARLFARYTNAMLYYPTVALYDANKTFISGEYPILSSTDERAEYNGMYGVFYTVPDGARYFRLSSAGHSVLEVYVITTETVGAKVEIPALDIPKSAIDGKTVVCFGDSLFGMYRGDDSAPAFIADETGATVHNVGFGGCRMATHYLDGYAAFSMWALAKAIAENDWTDQDAQASSGSAYFPEQLALLKSIDFSNVDMAVIHYGTNDFAAASESFQIDNDSDPDDYTSLCGALRYSLDKLLGAYPKLRIYISLPCFRFWTADDGTVTYSDAYTNGNGNTLPEYVQALRGVAQEYNLPVIDSYYGLGVNKVNAATFLSDGTHHNATGRERFGRYIGANLVAQR